MQNNFNMKDRYYEILSICKLSVEDFSKILEIHSNVFLRFISSNHITPKTALKINNMGININWLLFGQEPKYNETKKGYEIKKLFIDNQLNEIHFVFYKVKKWVELHYDSIYDFQEKFNLNNQDSIKMLGYTNQLTYNLSKTLKEEGLNLKWLYHNDEDPYNNKIAGKEKREWALTYLDNTSFIYNHIKI